MANPDPMAHFYTSNVMDKLEKTKTWKDFFFYPTILDIFITQRQETKSLSWELGDSLKKFN